jgi:hypothetical protein
MQQQQLYKVCFLVFPKSCKGQDPLAQTLSKQKNSSMRIILMIAKGILHIGSFSPEGDLECLLLTILR